MGAKDYVRIWSVLAPWKAVPEFFEGGKISWPGFALALLLGILPCVVSVFLLVKRWHSAHWLALSATGMAVVFAVVVCLSVGLILRMPTASKSSQKEEPNKPPLPMPGKSPSSKLCPVSGMADL